MASIFTKIINREIPAHIVAENDNFIAFLDAFPIKKGHTLVVPKKEVDYIFELDSATYSSLMEFTKTIAVGLKKAIPCEKVGVAVVGLEVPHVHVHLVPMDEVGDMNFSNPKLKFETSELEAVTRLIKDNL
jgi:histidine triad (HIT) family protein